MVLNLLDRNKNASIILAGILALIVGVGVARFVFTSLLPAMLEDYLSVTFAGVLASINYVGYLGGSIFAIFIKDINAKVKYFRIGMFLCVATTLVLGVSDNDTLWSISRVIAGFGAAMALVVGSAIVMTKLKMESKTKAMGIHFSGIGFSVLVTDLIVRFVFANGEDWRTAWIVLTVFGLVATLYSVYILSFDNEVKQNVTVHKFDKSLFTPFVLLLIVAYFTEGVGMVVQGTFLPDIINSLEGLSGFGGYTWTIAGLAGIPSCIIWMTLAHKYGSVNIIIIAMLLQVVVTDAETLDIARMVLVGKVNRDIVGAINALAPVAVGLSGEDGGLIEATARNPELGFVGDVHAVNPAMIHRLLSEDLVPVISTIGVDPSGQAYNINADTVAAAIAAALDAEKLIYLTDVAGLLADVDDAASLISRITADELQAKIDAGELTGGMIPKIDGCIHAVRHGGRTHPHPRRPHPARGAARGVHRFRHRNDGHRRTGGRRRGAHMSLMNTYPPHTTVFERGSGTELWDVEGRRYLDFLCGLAVTSLGHSHPVVAAAIAEQASKLQHVSNLFGTTVGPEVATTLCRLHGGDGKVFFANSGAEANECAIKIARKFGGRGRHNVITTYGSFHGRTLAALAATGQPSKHEPFQPVPEGFRHVALNDLAAMDAALDDTVAAVFIEPIQGEGGVNPADAEWMLGVQDLCRERGALFMLDEVQTGMCRTGEWWGYQHYGIEPDVVPMAKALGNGMPIGACWATGEAAEAFVPGDHGSTYGGQPLAAAAARAVLGVMEDIDAAGLARKQGERLREALLAREWVESVRGMGLLLGIEITEAARGERTAPQISAQLLDAGLVVNGITPTALRMAPPLTVSDAEIDEALDICDRIVGGTA